MWSSAKRGVGRSLRRTCLYESGRLEGDDMVVVKRVSMRVLLVFLMWGERDVPPCRGPPSCRGLVGGTETQREREKLALLPSRLNFPRSFRRFFSVWYPTGSSTFARTLLPLIARPPSNHVSSVGLRAHLGPHSMYIGLSNGCGCRKGGGASHRSRILRAACVRK
jgi:hypothetical protein